MLSGCIKNLQSLEPGYCAISHSVLHPMHPVQNYKSVQDKKCQVSLLCLNNQNHLSFFSCLFIFSDVIGFFSRSFHISFPTNAFFPGSSSSVVALGKGSTSNCDRITGWSTLEKSSETMESRLWLNSTLPMHRGTQCHIQSLLKHLRDRDCTSSLPGQPIPQATTLGFIRVRRVSRYLKYSHHITLFFCLRIQWCCLSLWFRNPIFPWCFQSRRKTLGFNLTIFSP